MLLEINNVIVFISRLLLVVITVTCGYVYATDTHYISRYAAAVVPQQMLTVPLSEPGVVEFCHKGEGCVEKGTLLVRVNAAELALEEAELKNQQRQNKATAEESLLKLRRQKEELEFIMAQPAGRRQFMEARFKTQADERALALLNEQIAVQEERVRISNEKLQQAFDKKKETREVRMPFSGRVQFHINPPAGEERTMPVAQTGPLLTAVDDGQLYVAVTPQEAEVVKLPPERLLLKLDLGGGKFLEAAWHHKKVEQRNRQETLVYYFALAEPDRAQAWEMVGANTVAELHYLAAEGEDLLYLHKHELTREAGERSFESWEELVAALRPGYEIVFTGETHICLRKKA